MLSIATRRSADAIRTGVVHEPALDPSREAKQPNPGGPACTGHLWQAYRATEGGNTSAIRLSRPPFRTSSVDLRRMSVV